MGNIYSIGETHLLMKDILQKITSYVRNREDTMNLLSTCREFKKHDNKLFYHKWYIFVEVLDNWCKSMEGLKSLLNNDNDTGKLFKIFLQKMRKIENATSIILSRNCVSIHYTKKTKSHIL
jgi:hypothetical protein